MSDISMLGIERYLAHSKMSIDPEMEDYAINEVMEHSRYIFTHKKRKQQYGYCTHCNQEYATHKLTHNNTTICTLCNSLCIVKSSKMGRSKMIDEAYFVYYQKSIIDPNVVIARGISVVRDYRFDYHYIDTQYTDRNLYIFKMGEATMLKRDTWYSWSDACLRGSGEYIKCKSVYSEFGFLASHHPQIVVGYCKDSIAQAVKDTPFQYSTWQSYRYDDMVRFFSLYSNYPCIEYLTKIGFDNIVEAKLSEDLTYSAINWRGANLLKVLKLSKSDFNELKNSNVRVDPLILKLYQIGRNDGSNISVEEVLEIEQGFSCVEFKTIQAFLKYAKLKKAYSYMLKQLSKKDKANKAHFYQINEVAVHWKDYIADCIALQMDLKDEKILYPGNLYKAHQNTIKQVKYKADKELSDKIKKMIKALSKQYAFEAMGLLIRPAESTEELIAEGKQLQHCVGGYAKRYAEGETVILLIRKSDEPGKPFFTVVISGGTVLQCRGLKNCSKTTEIEEFLKIFKSEKLEKKNKSRVKVPA